ncbi:hypothetical protein ABTD44_21415, partial [Acinetobacter baumannii]
DVGPGEPFAHMVPTATVARALWRRAQALGILLRPAGVASFRAEPGSLAVDFADGGAITASLLAACDGGRSRLRDKAGIR